MDQLVGYDVFDEGRGEGHDLPVQVEPPVPPAAPPAVTEVLDLDVIMRNTREMPPVRFPHKAHTLWLACANCHPEPFEPRAGANRIAMADIFRGRYCGVCHDRVAFITFYSCPRCHSVGAGG